MISVYLCSYNGQQFIEEQLRSIAKQTMQPDEVIISDDCSSDSTLDIVQAFIRENNLTGHWKVVLNTPKLGYPYNFYAGVERCSGEYIFWADQDDIWEANKLAFMYDILKCGPQINVLACNYDAIDEKNRRIDSLVIPKAKNSGKLYPIGLSDILYEYKWPGMVMVIRKSWAQQIMRAMAPLRIDIPHDLLFAVMAAQSGAFFCVDIIGAHHRRHNENTGQERSCVTESLNNIILINEIDKDIAIYQKMNKFFYNLYGQQDNSILAKIEWLQMRRKVLASHKLLDYLKYCMQNKKNIRIFSVIRDLLVLIISYIKG